MSTNMTFVDYVTPVPADWLNFVNAYVNNTHVNGVLVVASITALRAVSHLIATETLATGYYTSGDGPGGLYRYDPTDTTSSDNGGTVIVASDSARWKLQYNTSVTVSQFGAKPGSTDSTAAIQAAFNWGVVNAIPISVDADYSVTTITLTAANGYQVIMGGDITGIASTATDAILSLINCVDITFQGKGIISGNYNTNYTFGIHNYTAGAGTSAYVDMTNMSVLNVNTAFGYGSAGLPDAQVSEINQRGGYTYGCPNVVQAVGAETVVNITNATLQSSAGTGNTAWQAITQNTIIAQGATVNIVGGELLHTATTTGSLAQLEPITSATLGNVYGSIHVTGAWIENAAPLLVTGNLGLTAPTGGTAKFVGCKWVHTQNSFACVQTDSSFNTPNRLIFSGNDFSCTTARTFLNIACSGTCDVYCDDVSFGNNFLPPVAGIGGGIPHFSHRMVLAASNLGSEFFPASAITTCEYITLTASNDTPRFSSNYSSGTGIFTVPTGGLKNVVITAQTTTLPTITGEMYVELNGTALGVANFNKYANVSYSVGQLAAGDQIKIGILNTSGSTNAANASSDWFHIFASN